MSKQQQIIAGVAALVLVGIYSWIMMATSGSAASWAWILLVAVAALVVLIAWSARTANAGRRDESSDS